MRKDSSITELNIEIPFLPPSANNIYVNHPKGGRFLSNQAKTFQSRFSLEVLPNYLHLISRLDTTGIFELHLMYFFPTDEILNTTFGSGKKSAAKTRYKKMDVGNRSKLITDCLVKAIAVDDSLFFREVQDKYDCKLVGGKPQVRICLKKIDAGLFGV